MSEYYRYAGARALVRLHTPSPFHGHVGLGDKLYTPKHLLFSQLEGANPVGVKPAGHLADLMTALLKRQDPLLDHGVQKIISIQAGLDQDTQAIMNLVDLRIQALGVVT